MIVSPRQLANLALLLIDRCPLNDSWNLSLESSNCVGRFGRRRRRRGVVNVVDLRLNALNNLNENEKNCPHLNVQWRVVNWFWDVYDTLECNLELI